MVRFSPNSQDLLYSGLNNNTICSKPADKKKWNGGLRDTVIRSGTLGSIPMERE